MSKFFVLSFSPNILLATSEKEFVERNITTDGLKDLPKVLNDLSSLKNDFSVEFIQFLIRSCFVAGINSKKVIRSVCGFTERLFKEHLNLSLDVYKQFVSAQALSVFEYKVGDIDIKNLVMIVKDLYDQQFFNDDDVIEILYFLSKYTIIDREILKTLLNCVENFKAIFKDKTDSHKNEKIVEVGKILKAEIEKEDTDQPTKDEILDILKLLGVTDNVKDNETSESREIHESFKILIQKVLNNEEINEKIELKNNKAEIKYFLEFALNSVENAIKFSSILPTLFHDDPCSAYYFRSSLVSKLTSIFNEHLAPETKNNYSDDEIKVTCRFTAELLYRSYVWVDEIKIIVSFVANNCSESPKTLGYISMLQIILDYKSGNLQNSKTFDEVLDSYISKYTEDEIHSRNFKKFWVVCDEEVQRRWIGIMFDICAEKCRRVSRSINPVFWRLCKEVVTVGASEFTHEDVSEVIRDKIVEDFKRKAADLRTGEGATFELEYLEELSSVGLISVSDIITSWDLLAKEAARKPEITPSFVQFIQPFIKFIMNVYKSEDIEKLKNVIEFFNSQLYNKGFIAIRSHLRYFVRRLSNIIQNSYPKFDLQKENHPDADQSFINAVDKTINELSWYGVDFKFTNASANIKFFVENATKTPKRAKVFGSFLNQIFTENQEKFKSFKICLAAVLEKQFRKQHDPETKQEYSDEEIHATIQLICELLVQTSINVEKVRELNELIKGDSDPILQQYKNLMNIAITSCEINPNPLSSMDEAAVQYLEKIFMTAVEIRKKYKLKASHDEPCGFSQDTDTEIKKLWVEKLLNYGVEMPEEGKEVVEHCRRIVKCNPGKLSQDELKEMCKTEVVNHLDDIFDEMTASSSRIEIQRCLKFFGVLVKESMLTKKGIIKIWKAASEHLIDKWFTAQYLAAIIEKSLSIVDVLDDQESIDDIEAVRQTLRPHLNNVKLKKIQKKLKQINRNLEGLIENAKIGKSSPRIKPTQQLASCQPSTSKQSNKVQKSPEPNSAKEVTDSFKTFVEKLLNDQNSTTIIQFGDARADAEYFLERAIRNEKTVAKFAEEIESLGMEKFNKELFELVEDRFRKHHNPLTQSDFPETEIKALTLFVIKLFLPFRDNFKKMEHFMNIIKIQPQMTEASRSCLELMKNSVSNARIPMTLIEILSMEKEKIEASLNRPPHPDEIYFESFLKTIFDEDKECYLKSIPTDPAMAKKWVDMLLEKGLKNRSCFPTLIETFNFIYQGPKTDSSLSFKKTIETKVLQLLDETLKKLGRNTTKNNVEKVKRVLTFILEMIQIKVISQIGILYFWKTMADNIDEDFALLAPVLVSMILETQSNVEQIEGKKQQTIVNQVREKIFEKMSTEFSKKSMKVKETVQCLDELMKNSKISKALEESASQPKQAVVKLTPEQELQKFLTLSSDLNIQKLTIILEMFDAREKAIKCLVKAFMNKPMVKQHNTGQLLKQIDADLKKNLKLNNEETFKTVLTSTIQNSFKKLPKFDQLTTEDEINQAEAAVKLTGELYNIGWIDQPKLISCMDKLSANNFGSDHQLRMFHDLLKTVESEMIRQKHIGKSKFCIDLLILSESSKKVRNLKCIEVLRRISTFNVKKNEEKTDEFDDLLNRVTDETLNIIAKEISAKFSTNTDERILTILEKFTAKALESPKLFAKVLKVSDSALFTSFVLDQCQENFMKITNGDKIDPKLTDLLKFIGELYNEGLATGEFVKVCMDVLFGIETPCEVAVDSISALVRTVCVEMEISDKENLDRYFKYFGYVISQKEESYRSKVFEFLVALKSNGWKSDENAAKPLVDHHFGGLSEGEIPSIALKLQRLIDGSVEVGVAVIRKIWEIVIVKPELIKLCVGLTKDLSNVELDQEDSKLKFCDLLTQFLTQRREAFMAIPDDQFNDKIKARLGQVVVFITYLYLQKTVGKDLLKSWLDEELIDNFTVGHAAEISKLLRDCSDDSLFLPFNVKLMFLEEKIEMEINCLELKLKQELNQVLIG